MTQKLNKKAEKTKSYQIITALVGLLFVVIAITLVFITDNSIAAVSAEFIIGLLGVDALISAYKKKESLLFRIGPLP